MTNLTLLGDNKELIILLKKVFHRAGLIDENFKSDNNNIEKGQSILVIEDSVELKKYESYLKKFNSGIDSGELNHGFLWTPNSNTENNGELESLISTYLNRKITYSRHNSVIRFTEDVIKTLEIEIEKEIKNNNVNLSIFYNIIDKDIGSNTCEILLDIFKIHKVPVDSSNPNLNVNKFSEIALEANVIVIVFDNQKEWAEIFAQEIWKKIGGVSTGIPILLIGTDSKEESKISVPNLKIASASKDLLALEIKVQHDELVK